MELVCYNWSYCYIYYTWRIIYTHANYSVPCSRFSYLVNQVNVCWSSCSELTLFASWYAKAAFVFRTQNSIDLYLTIFSVGGIYIYWPIYASFFKNLESKFVVTVTNFTKIIFLSEPTTQQLLEKLLFGLYFHHLKSSLLLMTLQNSMKCHVSRNYVLFHQTLKPLLTISPFSPTHCCLQNQKHVDGPLFNDGGCGTPTP